MCVTNPKFEYRNRKQTRRQINLNRENPKHRIRRKLVCNFTYFGHLRLFRISDFVLRISYSLTLLILSVLRAIAATVAGRPDVPLQQIRQASPLWDGGITGIPKVPDSLRLQPTGTGPKDQRRIKRAKKEAQVSLALDERSKLSLG
jgi:hypothetical protein